MGEINYLSGMVGFCVLLIVLLANLVGYKFKKLEKSDSELQRQIDDLKRELEEGKRKLK